MWVLLGILFRLYGYGQTWELWNVPVEKPVFLDFRLIPGSAESFRKGFEPSIKNPFDPYDRLFNYPAFWRLFFYTNISMDDTVWIVIILIVLYFICVILFPEKLSILGALLMLSVVFSPASMLLYERGNADLFVFLICVAVILSSTYSANLTALLIIFGTVVKIFPLFGSAIFLRESKRRFLLLILCVSAFIIFFGFLTFESQSAAWNTTMRGDEISYGSFVIITRLHGQIQALFPGIFSVTGWKLFFEGSALLSILFFIALAVRRQDVLTASYDRNLSAFRMGASIYVGTFLLGNNWDYRLAFLVLVIPQLSDWMQSATKKHWVAYFTTGLVLLAVMHFMLKFDLIFLPLKNPDNRKFLFDETVNWLLLICFSYLLAASFPVWLKQDLQKWIGAGKK